MRALSEPRIARAEGSEPSITACRRVRPAGLEPATPGLGNRCSILLSYGRENIHCNAPSVLQHSQYVLILQLLAAIQGQQLDQERDPFHTPAELFHQIDRGARRASSGEQIVDDQYALPP